MEKNVSELAGNIIRSMTHIKQVIGELDRKEAFVKEFINNIARSISEHPQTIKEMKGEVLKDIHSIVTDESVKGTISVELFLRAHDPLNALGYDSTMYGFGYGWGNGVQNDFFDVYGLGFP